MDRELAVKLLERALSDPRVLSELHSIFQQKYRGVTLGPRMRLRAVAELIASRILAEHPELVRELEKLSPAFKSLPTAWLIKEAIVRTLTSHYSSDLERLLKALETGQLYVPARRGVARGRLLI